MGPRGAAGSTRRVRGGVVSASAPVCRGSAPLSLLLLRKLDADQVRRAMAAAGHDDISILKDV